MISLSAPNNFMKHLIHQIALLTSALTISALDLDKFEFYTNGMTVYPLVLSSTNKVINLNTNKVTITNITAEVWTELKTNVFKLSNSELSIVHAVFPECTCDECKYPLQSEEEIISAVTYIKVLDETFILGQKVLKSEGRHYRMIPQKKYVE
jgi:hypothetical protein